MTVCPKCNGNGSVPYPVDYEQGLFDETNCDLCGGSGEVEMTNEEWLRICSTEQLAEFIADVCYELVDDICANYDDTSCNYRQTDKNYWVRWLKEKYE